MHHRDDKGQGGGIHCGQAQAAGRWMASGVGKGCGRGGAVKGCVCVSGRGGECWRIVVGACMWKGHAEPPRAAARPQQGAQRAAHSSAQRQHGAYGWPRTRVYKYGRQQRVQAGLVAGIGVGNGCEGGRRSQRAARSCATHAAEEAMRAAT